MPVIESQLDTLSEDYAKNREAMQKVVDEFRSVENKVIEKSESQRPKFEKRGKMLPHDRLARLLDAGSPFLSLMSLAGYMRHDDKDGTEAGGNSIAGIGYVSGVRCMVVASNSAIKGGTISSAVPDFCELEVDRRMVPGETPEQVVEILAYVIDA